MLVSSMTQNLQPQYTWQAELPFGGQGHQR